MKRILQFSSFLFLFLIGCKNEDEKATPPSENDIDAVRNFIRAALDGKFDQARTFMLNDSLNTQYLDAVERSYQKMQQDTIDRYKSASIRIQNPIIQPNDSTRIIIYSNSFKNDLDTLKVIRINGQWIVDLKYLFNHDMDTLMKSMKKTDSLP